MVRKTGACPGENCKEGMQVKASEMFSFFGCFVFMKVRAGQENGEGSENKLEATYSPQMIIDCTKLLLVTRVRPAAHEDLVPPFDPALYRLLSEIDFLSLVPASECIEINP